MARRVGEEAAAADALLPAAGLLEHLRCAHVRVPVYTMYSLYRLIHVRSFRSIAVSQSVQREPARSHAPHHLRPRRIHDVSLARVPERPPFSPAQDSFHPWLTRVVGWGFKRMTARTCPQHRV